MLFIIGSVTAKEKKLSFHIAYQQRQCFLLQISSLINNESLLLLPPIKKIHLLNSNVCHNLNSVRSIWKCIHRNQSARRRQTRGEKKNGRWQRTFVLLIFLSFPVSWARLRFYYQFYWMHRSGVKILKISCTIVIEAYSREIATLIRAMIVNRSANKK